MKMQYSPTIIDGCDSVPKLFRQRIQSQGEKIAMREKHLGIWKPITWAEYGERARDVSMGLISFGLNPGDVVSIIADNMKEWLFSDMGIVCAGGVTSGIYTTDSSNQVSYLVNDSGSRFLLVENDEQLDKALSVKNQMPKLEKIIVFDMKGLRDFHDPDVISIEELYDRGRIYQRNHKDLWDQRIDGTEPDDLLLLVYTSGTTGAPKGAMISNANVMFQMISSVNAFQLGDQDELLSFLPLCHIVERGFSVHLPLYCGATVNFVEQADTVPENMQELSPTTFFAVPRIWEKFYSSVSMQVKDATMIGRWSFDKSLAVCMKGVEAKLSGKSIGLVNRLGIWLADRLVMRNLRTMLGMDRMKVAITGAAPISPDLIKWYQAIGVNLVEGYGQTESVGLASCNPVDRIKLGSIGVVDENKEMRISDQGEILIRGRHVFMGYFNQPEKTAETIVEGWLHTGDVGNVDEDGYFKITDRMKDIIITAGGKNITPSEIENQIKFSPFISDAVIIGDKRKYLTCLIMIDRENVENYAQEKDIPFTDYVSLCRAHEVKRLIEIEIQKVNDRFARVESVKKFRLIEKLLTAEDDELTATMKLKRSFVEKKYKNLIDEMYSS